MRLEDADILRPDENGDLVGLKVGVKDVDGDCVSAVLSAIFEGFKLGVPLGIAVTSVGCSDGLLVGSDVANFTVGNNDGYDEGLADCDSLALYGVEGVDVGGVEGVDVGAKLGVCDGGKVGVLDGARLGLGASTGEFVGRCEFVGTDEVVGTGEAVGSSSFGTE